MFQKNEIFVKNKEGSNMLMKKFRKKAVSLLAVIAMVTTLLPQNLVVQAAKNETEVIDYSKLNDEIYDNLEDYPAGDMEENGEIFEEAVTVETVEEYYQAVGENLPMAYDVDGDEVAIPSAADNSINENAKYFPPILNQYGGSCACYAYVYELGSYIINQARDKSSQEKNNVLSPLFVYNFFRTGASTSNGCYSAQTPEVMLKVGAATAEYAPISTSYTNYKYTWYPTEEAWKSATDNRIESAIRINDISHTGTPITSATDSDLEVIKTTLSSGKIIAFATGFRTFNYTLIPTDSPSHAGEHAVDRCDYYYQSSDGSRDYGGHAMVIVGYDDDIWIDVNRDGEKQTGEYGALKIANSHGTSYKNTGFVWVAYDALNKVSSVITDADVERVNAAINAGTMTGYKIQNQYREDFFRRYNAIYTYTASSEESASSKCRLVTTFNTTDRQDIRVVITATNKTTGQTSSYKVTVFDGYSKWSTKYALNGSKSATDGTIVTDLDNVISSITPDTVDDYTWSVSVTDKNSATVPLTVKDICIKANDNKVLVAAVENDTLNGSSETYTLEKASLEVTDFAISMDSPVSLVDTVTFTASAAGGSQNYEYRFGSIFEGKEYEITDGFQTASTTSYQFSRMITDETGMGTAQAVGTHTLFVDVKDTETGTVVRKTIENYQVKPLEITSFTAEKASPQKVGTSIKLNAEVQYEAGYRYNTYKFVVIKDGVETNIAPYNNVQYSATWTPTEVGTYTLKYYVKDYLGQEATATMEYRITEEQLATIYYSSSWSQAYIHYKTGDGEWTTVPGVQMEAASDQDGYQWKYIIDLGDAEGATICFNNGNGSWDSKNGSNYSVGIGTYGVKDGTVKQLTVAPTATPTSTPTATPTVAPTATPTATPTVAPTATPTSVPTATPTSVPTATPSPTPTTIVTNNKSTIYYSNDSWSQAYIHYKTGDGEWTTVPGVQMEKNTSANGYTWKYVIDLEKADGATVCFNNGNGSWDSKNGSNYSLGVGSYGIKNGTIEELQEGMTVNISADKAVGGTYTKTTFTAVAENGTEPYSYQFAVVAAGSIPTSTSYTTAKEDATYNYTPYTAKEYTVYAKVTDAEGNVAETSMDYTVEGAKWDKFVATADDKKVGTVVTLEAEYINCQQDSYNYYSFVVEKDDAKTEYYAGKTGYLEWTPEEEGTYTITARFHSFSGEVFETSIEYTVSNGNTATIYYNSSWDNAYIHYCIAGGSWNTVPGVAMTKTSEKEGYTYKYVIDLDDAESVTVCFNNGSGSWDSNNGANYTISAGSYGVSSGVISEIK